MAADAPRHAAVASQPVRARRVRPPLDQTLLSPSFDSYKLAPKLFAAPPTRARLPRRLQPPVAALSATLLATATKARINAAALDAHGRLFIADRRGLLCVERGGGGGASELLKWAVDEGGAVSLVAAASWVAVLRPAGVLSVLRSEAGVPPRLVLECALPGCSGDAVLRAVAEGAGVAARGRALRVAVHDFRQEFVRGAQFEGKHEVRFVSPAAAPHEPAHAPSDKQQPTSLAALAASHVAKSHGAFHTEHSIRVFELPVSEGGAALSPPLAGLALRSTRSSREPFLVRFDPRAPRLFVVDCGVYEAAARAADAADAAAAASPPLAEGGGGDRRAGASLKREAPPRSGDGDDDGDDVDEELMRRVAARLDRDDPEDVRDDTAAPLRGALEESEEGAEEADAGAHLLETDTCVMLFALDSGRRLAASVAGSCECLAVLDAAADADAGGAAPSVTIALRRDVDMAVYRVEATGEGAGEGAWALHWRHESTFPGLAFVQDGKRNRRFVLLSPAPRSPLAAVAEHTRLVFVYRQPPPGAVHAEQAVADLERGGGALAVAGAVLAPRRLVCVAEDEVFDFELAAP